MLLQASYLSAGYAIVVYIGCRIPPLRADNHTGFSIVTLWLVDSQAMAPTYAASRLDIALPQHSTVARLFPRQMWCAGPAFVGAALDEGFRAADNSSLRQ